MNGLLIIDKPQGLTSHDVVRQMRRLLKTRRIGHTGTLDPLATGVLPVAIGQGTRLVQFLLERDKVYRATMKLGETTDTQDCLGRILESLPVAGIREDRILEVAASFVGSGEQVPPMYSALKRDGMPLYKLARQGIEVERPARPILIDYLQILSINLPLISFEVSCSKGTYVRTLCHDMGIRLGTGAHMTSLRRLRSGSFEEQQAVTLEQLRTLVETAKPLPMLSLRDSLADWPALQLSEGAVQRLANGIPPCLEEVSGPRTDSGERVALVNDDRLLAVARFAPDRSREKRGDFELLRVFLGGECG